MAVNTVRRSTVANALTPALELLRDLRADLALGNVAKALGWAEELATVLYEIEGDCGSVTPQSLFDA